MAMSNRGLRVLFVTSEVTPYSKTGGLGDISAALPTALVTLGCDVKVLTPRYGFMDRERFGIASEDHLPKFSVDFKGQSLQGAFSRANGTPGKPTLHLVECDSLYDRLGIYVDPFTNRDFIDNDYRFIFLSRSALELCRLLDWTPDVIHCNDWQTALIPFYLYHSRSAARYARARSLLTIHNIAYHGLFGPETAGRIGGAEKYYFPGGPLEFYGHVNFLKAGLEFADGLNTVSPTYAREIQSSYEFGYGLETVLRARGGQVAGIINGIDVDVWNPATDHFIATRYTADTLDQKWVNKRALCERLGFTFESSVPVIGIISRIVGQKGFEILAPVLDEVLNIPTQVVLLGTGDPHFEHMFREFARIFPDKFAVRIGYDEELAHIIEAGADLLLMPSKYEPCGLNQMMSMRYGTIPVVRATGGLADTVTDADRDGDHATGFSFLDYKPETLLHAVRRAVKAFHHPERWRQLQRNAMAMDFSWNHSAKLYMELYRQDLAKPPRVLP
jgi:starch synthase